MPISAETLRKHKAGEWFIETGCDAGEGIQAALDAGFEAVLSIELDMGKVTVARSRFAKEHRPVTILHGDTSLMLPIVLAEVSQRSTFWLDGHSDKHSPVLEELAAFCAHPIKDHTILIDDRRLMHGHWGAVMENRVRAAILAINPGYVISLDHGIVANDIIVAKVP